MVSYFDCRQLLPFLEMFDQSGSARHFRRELQQFQDPLATFAELGDHVQALSIKFH
jgi:hypothetical protein